MSVVRDNMIKDKIYTPYCGSMNGCNNPRTFFNGEQMECPHCNWESKFEPEFIEQYKSTHNL